MALTERDRLELFRKAEEVFGADRAVTLMELLPPVGWAEVATKTDLDQLADRLRAELQRDLRTQFQALLAANATLVALAVGLTQLLT